MARREFEYIRHGTVTFLASYNGYDGTMWGCSLEANNHEHFLRALGQLARRYPRARRLHLIMDNRSSHIAYETKPTPPAIGAFRRSIHPHTPAGSIKRNCCDRPSRISILSALIPRLGNISSTIRMPVGQSTINGSRIPSSGHGAATICMRGPRRRAR